ncbi:SRPBCC family protein [Roseibium sp. HPY-6]|uniref:aromatic ring-hydroxylating oxygenase subunit alpha n=1 Tax=Roseibium sp. HPY-6 TaxID=3229852 RepID=UPI00338E8049
MDRAQEIALLEELIGLNENGLFFLDDAVQFSLTDRYVSEDRFDREMSSVFRRSPLIAAHASELPERGSYLTRQISGLPVLLTREKDGTVNAFLNVCRHRGARLVAEDRGCKHAFSCPYHAWTWDSSGSLRGIPHEKQGFPDLDRSAYALKRLPVTERLGLIWIVADPRAQSNFDTFLEPVKKDFAWLGMAGLGIAACDQKVLSANWKLLLEGGLEAYHFKVTHKETIGPHFLDSLSSYQMLGPHIRSVLPRATATARDPRGGDSWSIQDHANVLYTVFPLNQFLAMQDHVAWISLNPLAADRTEARIVTLAPRETIDENRMDHWRRNHRITLNTLSEDFAVNEAAQDGMASGANEFLTFGRYEGALHRFNAEVERRL